MIDPFLQAVGVHTEERAIRESLLSALGRNKTYRDGPDDGIRIAFRTAWATLIRDESRTYAQPVSDSQHCEIIQRISDTLSSTFGELLIDGRLRYGTSQKALNLYLKYLWRLEIITATPPHCPVDRQVLTAGGIDGTWTKCDSEKQYMEWIGMLRVKAKPLCLAEWEYGIWMPSK